MGSLYCKLGSETDSDPAKQTNRETWEFNEQTLCACFKLSVDFAKCGAIFLLLTSGLQAIIKLETNSVTLKNDA